MPNLNTVIRTEFAAAIAQIASERHIPQESIYQAIEQALVSAYRKEIGELEEDAYYFVKLNKETGSARIFKAPVLERDQETEEITKWDEDKAEDVTPAGFGRIAAQTAKQVILQKIRQSEKDQIITDYQDKVGEVVTGQVLRMDRRTVVVNIGRGQGYMPPEEQMRGEFYRTNQRLAVLIKEIGETFRGQTIVVSRADQELVVKLFEREVPEVASGAVEIINIAREAGVRSKLAVASTQEGVDPVGSCVGQRGVRVQKVIEELNNEKIDIIPFSENLELYLQAALAPAENLKIELKEEEKLAVVTAPDDQLSLVIGRGGQNVRLAAKLTGYKITVQSDQGQVKSQVTGQEEYEVDTIKGLTEEARDYLIHHKLTTVADLQRFSDKWLAAPELDEDQTQLLKDFVAEYEAAQLEREAKRAARVQALKDQAAADEDQQDQDDDQEASASKVDTATSPAKSAESSKKVSEETTTDSTQDQSSAAQQDSAKSKKVAQDSTQDQENKPSKSEDADDQDSEKSAIEKQKE
ncbi:MAG: transcription termination/antitermination protein NusA [Candidatus Pacebacteria bacterium]|nr:transcription termination/antitermination protein NusA [Candidatus Paceibacterota bacterium]